MYVLCIRGGPATSRPPEPTPDIILCWIALRCSSSVVNAPATPLKAARAASVISLGDPNMEINSASKLDEERGEDSGT